jgi:nuclear transport factor 2 (NTF2) superfamily protein
MEIPMLNFSPVALQRVRAFERAWNAGDVEAIVYSNAIDCFWRVRMEFLWGREQIRSFMERQARCEIDLRVVCEPWAETHRRLSVRFAAEFHNDSGTWFRVLGSEDIEFDTAGLACRRFTAANEHPIREYERMLRWQAGPPPVDHPTPTELGF